MKSPFAHQSHYESVRSERERAALAVLCTAGSIVHGYDYDYDGGEFSDLCLRRMEGDQEPWESELNVVAMVLVGVAWLTLVLRKRWQLRTKPALFAHLVSLPASRTGNILPWRVSVRFPFSIASRVHRVRCMWIAELGAIIRRSDYQRNSYLVYRRDVPMAGMSRRDILIVCVELSPALCRRRKSSGLLPVGGWLS